MRFQKPILFVLVCISVGSAGCTSSSSGSSQSETDAAIQKMAANLPREIDAATTLVEIKSDGQGGIVSVEEVDTTKTNIPSRDKLTRKLCGVRSDSPPAGNHAPFSGWTFIYTDMQGNELTRLHFGPGECPGIGL